MRDDDERGWEDEGERMNMQGLRERVGVHEVSISSPMCPAPEYVVDYPKICPILTPLFSA